MGVDALGVDERELGEGLFPVGDDLALDEAALGFPVGGGTPGFLGAFVGSFVFDGADREPEQLHHGLVVGEMASVLADLAELVVQRLDAVGGVIERELGYHECRPDQGTEPQVAYRREVCKMGRKLWPKDPLVLAFLDGLTEAGCEWELQDHWEGDLSAVGVSSPHDARQLAYVSTWGQSNGLYHVELEGPAVGVEPYETVRVVDSVDLATAVRLVSDHITMPMGG